MNLRINSRFSSLKQESSSDSRYKKRSPYNRSDYSNNSFKSNNKYKKENSGFLNKVILENENKQREKLLNLDNFPELSNVSNNNQKSKISNKKELNCSFKDSIEKVEEIIIDNKLPSGWIQISKNTIFTPPLTISSEEPLINYSKIIYNLCKNYDNYIENYITVWGEEEYINMHHFPNYEAIEDSDESDIEPESSSSDID
jgi:hypothetical protein